MQSSSVDDVEARITEAQALMQNTNTYLGTLDRAIEWRLKKLLKAQNDLMYSNNGVDNVLSEYDDV